MDYVFSGQTTSLGVDAGAYLQIVNFSTMFFDLLSAKDQVKSRIRVVEVQIWRRHSGYGSTFLAKKIIKGNLDLDSIFNFNSMIIKSLPLECCFVDLMD
jgi:hypothetical protein